MSDSDSTAAMAALQETLARERIEAAAGVELQAAAIEAVQAGVLLPRLRDAVAVVLELQRDADQRIAAERARMT